MSNFQQWTRHPETGEVVLADWLDDYFGRHIYGVRFPGSDKVFRTTECYPQTPVDHGPQKGPSTARRIMAQMRIIAGDIPTRRGCPSHHTEADE